MADEISLAPNQNAKPRQNRRNRHKRKNKGSFMSVEPNSDMKSIVEGLFIGTERISENDMENLMLELNDSKTQPSKPVYIGEKSIKGDETKKNRKKKHFIEENKPQSESKNSKQDAEIHHKDDTPPNSVLKQTSSPENPKPQPSGKRTDAEIKCSFLKMEVERRLLYWRSFFQNSKHWLLVLDYHNVHLLRTVRGKTPRAQFVCQLCSYYCDDLECVMSHVNHQRHTNKLRHSLVISTSVRIPPLSNHMTNMVTQVLENTYDLFAMTSYDVKQRSDFVMMLNSFIKEKLPGCSLRIFGSSAHGMGLLDSDLNIDLVVTDDDLHGPTQLVLLADLLEQELSICKDVTRLFTVDADFPHLKFFLETRPGKFITCAISLDNESAFKLGILLQKYSLIDYRVKKLCALFRLWGKMCHIDQEARGTWPGYSFYLMVIFFLQQKHVLPVLHDYVPYDENEDPENPDNYADPSDLKAWECGNRNDIGKLWIHILRFYAIDFDCTKQLISIQHGLPLLRNEQQYWGGGKRIAVVDPFRPKRNIMRAICHDATYDYIISCLHTTYLYYSIPHTSEGPIFGYIRPRIEVEQLYIPDVQYYIKNHRSLEMLLMDLIITTDASYSGTFVHNVPHTLKHLGKANFTNLTNLDLSHFRAYRTEKIIPPQNKYKDMVIHLDEAKYLIDHVDPDAIFYQFGSWSFTHGKMVPLICALCQKEGHTIAACPEEILEELEKLPPLSTETIDDLTTLCNIVYEKNVPSFKETLLRYDIVKELEDIIVTLHADAKLTLFGSSCNGFGLRGSDLDVCLTFSSNDSGKDLDAPRFIKTLCADLRKESNFHNLVSIPSARVPIIKFLHRPSMLEGDLSLYNTLALENTKLLRTYSQIDKRAQLLGYMMKQFAKLCNIGYASKGSLSSYSHTLMTIFFLQRCNPPVLPVLQELTDKPDGTIPVNLIDGCNAYFYSNLKTLHLVWPGLWQNTKSEGELWIELLRFYTEEFDISAHVISIRSSKKVTKFSKQWSSKCIAIEDPFDVNRNLASPITRKMNIFIIKAFRKGRLHFALPMKSTHPPTNEGLVNYYFDPKVLADIEPPNDRGCHFCKAVWHKVMDCPEKPKKQKDKQVEGGSTSRAHTKETRKQGANTPKYKSRTFFPSSN